MGPSLVMPKRPFSDDDGLYLDSEEEEEDDDDDDDAESCTTSRCGLGSSMVAP